MVNCYGISVSRMTTGSGGFQAPPPTPVEYVTLFKAGFDLYDKSKRKYKLISLF